MAKNQIYATKDEAFSSFAYAKNLAQIECDRMNENDPTLNFGITTSTDETNKRYILTRPDQMDGIQTIYFSWR